MEKFQEKYTLKNKYSSSFLDTFLPLLTYILKHHYKIISMTFVPQGTLFSWTHSVIEKY